MAESPYTPYPTVQPQVQAPNDIQRIQTNPAEFGGAIAEGEQKFGAGASVAGKFFGQVAADDATNQYMQGTHDVLYGTGKIDPATGQADQGYYGLKGKAALDARPGVEQKISDLQKELRGNLATPDQQLQYDTNTRRMQYYLTSEMGRFGDQQADNYAVDVNKTGAQNVIQSISARPEDDVYAASAAQQLLSYRTKLAQVTGDADSPEKLQQIRTQTAQDVAEARVKALIPTDPDKAMNLLNVNRATLATSPNYDALTRELQGIADKNQADGVVRSIVTGVGSGSSTPPTPSAPTSIKAAILGQESGNSDTAPPSANGAIGPGQVKPATFAQYAKPGEDINNPTDNRAVSGRIVDDLSAKYPNDAARVAVGYFSGPGNVAPPGSANPWLKDAKDANGKTVSSYVSDVVGRLNGAQSGFPSRDDWIGKIPDNLSDAQYERVYSQLNRTYNQMVQATSAQRAQMQSQIKGGTAMLADGKDFFYDPTKIRSLFPPEQADAMISQLDDATVLGKQVIAVQGMSPQEINDQEAANEASLNQGDPTQYAEQRRVANAFQKAAKQHSKDLLSDPAAYVASTNSQIQSAQQAATGQNAPVPAREDYAAKTLAEQDRLGVPDTQQHVLSVSNAQSIAKQIMGDPQNAPDTLKSLSQQWGSAWPSVWRDLTTTGKLPAAYQAVGVLDDPAQASLLARGLSEQGKSGKNLIDLLPPKANSGTSGIDTQVQSSPDLHSLMMSLSRSGASASMQTDVLGAVKTLAYANVVYNGADSATAADKAVSAFTSQYDFMPNGGARVPAKQFDQVSQSAAQTMQGLDFSNISVPKLYGQPGQPSTDDYLRVLKSAPTWITSPKADALWLMDQGGRIVRDPKGSPISVPFNAPPSLTNNSAQPSFSDALAQGERFAP